MEKCSVKNCGGDRYSSGLCSRHYSRLRTTGTTDDGPRARGSLVVRFWKYVVKTKPNECWEWTAKSRIRGYGVIKLDGTTEKMLAHRVAWMLSKGEIPKSDSHHGTVVRHKCNNRLCCNPRHLILGQQGDNVADMWKTSSKPGNARLTSKQIAEIRSDPRSSRQLAPIYGVHDAHIRNIRSRKKAWKNP